MKKKSEVHIPRQSAVNKHRQFLRKLHHAAEKKDEKKVKHLIRKAKPSQLVALCETSSNFLQGTYPGQNKRLVAKLRPFKSLLRFLACQKTKIASKKKELLKVHQQGGFLPLAPLLGPVLSSVLGGAIASLVSN